MNESSSLKPVQILLVEDSVADVELTREVLRETKIVNEVSVVSDGEEAIALLRQGPPYSERPRPDLVLLDLNLPKKDGREVLEEIKSDSVLRRIPVVVLTTSGAERDILHAYDKYVNAYVQKPLDLSTFGSVARAIDDFWLGIVRLPGR